MSRTIRLVLSSILISVALWNPYSVSAQTQETKIILALDASGSMRGGGIATIRSAAASLIKQLPKGSELSLYTFSAKPQLIQDFTSNQGELIASLNQIVSGGDTALYDSILQLLPVAKSNSASIIIFTDGKDSSSKSALAALLQSTKESKIKINFVTYQVGDLQRTILSSISMSTNGALYNASSISELAASFTAALTNATTPTSPLPKTIATPTSSDSKSQVFALTIALSSTLLSGLLFQIINRARKRNLFVNRWGNVLDAYEVRRRDLLEKSTTSPLKAQITGFFLRLVGDTSALFPAGADLRFRSFVLSCAYVGLVILFLFSALPAWISIIFATTLFVIAIRIYIQRKSESVLLAFEVDLPGALKLISASLAAGLSFLQALETFATENKSEVARQFRRALSEIQMGTPVEKALNGVAHRMKSKDLEWAVFAFSVQREVGGSLAKILSSTADTINSRAEIRREVRTLSAEGRLSSYILMALPIGIFIFLLFARPQFISIFWQEQIGHYLLALIALGMTCAWLWIRRLIRISV